MNYDPHLYREKMEEEKAAIALRSRIRAARAASGEYVSFRSRVSRFLVGMAFSVDPEAGRREFWGRATESEAG